ncbi:YdcF family protein [Priestia abyssalis]|uniref:YdcF family protein n=1 Tax=Priestia abyssalis TaxID=1221450 RepID=UPI0009953DB3|nr:YdcF family protein [Priestia abyssalis]
MKKRKWILIFLFVLIGTFLYTAGSIISVSFQNEQVKTDAAVVLGAAVINDKPSPVLKERINHAVLLYRKGMVEKIIFTGGKSEEDTLAESEAGKQYALSKGVHQEDMFIETHSAITEENLQQAKEIGEKQQLRTYTIVSDPLHMKRAMVMAHDFGMAAYPSPTGTSAYQSWKTKLPFLAREVFFYTGYMLTKPFRG